MNRPCIRTLTAALLLTVLSACGAQSGIEAGIYTGSGSGHNGPLTLSVQVDALGKLTAVTDLQCDEDLDYAEQALEILPGRIVEQQSLGVDAVSGATITSRAIFAAVADAVAQAGLVPEELGYLSQDKITETDAITLVGLPGQEITLTGGQLKSDYPPVTLNAVSISSSGEEKEITATGVTLAAILERFGADLTDYEAVLTVATDGYSIEIPSAILRTRDVLIAYEVNGEPQSPRTVIPDERAMYWSKFLCRIELLGTQETSALPATQVLLLESLLATLSEQAEPYKYYDATASAIALDVLLETHIPERSEFVRIRSADGLDKNERYDVFRRQYLLFEGAGEDTPLFTGPDLPAGMRVKQILTIGVGPVSLLCLSRAQEVLEGSASLADLLELAGLPLEDWAEYQLEDVAGVHLILNGIALAEATLALGADGLPTLHFPAGQEHGPFDGLLSITALAGEPS